MAITDAPAPTTSSVPRYTGKARPHVLLTTEGTYPHYTGGVSTWCDQLVHELGEVDFTIWALMMNPFIKQQFSFPENVRNFVAVPLWGVEQPAEYTRELPTAHVFRASRRTRERDIEDRFLPLFENFITSVSSPIFSATGFAENLVAMHDYFREWDYRTTWRSRPVWEMYKALAVGRPASAQYIADHYEEDEPVLPTFAGVRDNLDFLIRGKVLRREIDLTVIEREDEIPTVAEGVEGLRTLYRLMQPLNFEVPETDVTHSAAAAFCALPCLLAKLERGTPFLLTEHGVYLREQYLAIERRRVPYNLKRFLINLISAIAQTSYQLADQVSPVCAFNSRWEYAYGVPQERLKVIYNGVDPETFRPLTVERHAAPTVVQVGRIDPLKDQITLLRVADVVRHEVPGVKFVHYGPVADDEYGEKVFELHKELGLQDVVEFRGSTKEPAKAYAQGDVVLLTSISEAFPYAVVESLMCGKPVVSTAVGGVHEALEGGIGRTAPAHDVTGLATAVIHYLRLTNAERDQLGEQARRHALENFTLQRFLNNYGHSYRGLARQAVLIDRSERTIDLSGEAVEAEPVVVLDEQPVEQAIELRDAEPAVTTSLDLTSIEVVEKYLRGQDVFAKVEALRRVQPLPGVARVIGIAAEDDVATVREEAVLALGRLGDPSSLDIVTRALSEDPSPEVREAAVSALLDLTVAGHADERVSA